MSETVNIATVLKRLPDWTIIDVRSPGEYFSGHIPGAINIPLFTDEERATVGTLYKQKSPEAAMQEGLAIAGLKMADLVEKGKPYSSDRNKKLLIHCWRGGKRSQAVEWLYRFSGIPCYRLEGGYKVFRQTAIEFFQDLPFRLNILGGCTGAGKTEILHTLVEKGEQIIDLEKLANHKGSAFGAIGEANQPSTEQFENNLYLAFRSLDPARPVWLENESKSIGRVYVPDGLWHRMRSSTLYTIEANQAVRLKRALRYYSEPAEVSQLKQAFFNISKRLGGLEYKRAIQALDQGDLTTAAGIALDYYDKMYNYQLSQWPQENVVLLRDGEDIHEVTLRLLEMDAYKNTMY